MHELFPWAPAALRDPWLLLALTTPVQFWVGWEFHVAFLKELRHRTTSMNTLVSIGTNAAYFFSLAVTLWPHVFMATGAMPYYEASAVLMTFAGAIMAPRWSYISPNTVFSAMVSFQVVIMALLGGMHRLWGPVLGVIPIVVLSEFLSTTFPRAYAILLGGIFLLIVYFLPNGVAGIVEGGWGRLKARFGPTCATPGASPTNG